MAVVKGMSYTYTSCIISGIVILFKKSKRNVSYSTCLNDELPIEFLFCSLLPKMLFMIKIFSS